MDVTDPSDVEATLHALLEKTQALQRVASGAQFHLIFYLLAGVATAARMELERRRTPS